MVLADGQRRQLNERDSAPASGSSLTPANRLLRTFILANVAVDAGVPIHHGVALFHVNRIGWAIVLTGLATVALFFIDYSRHDVYLHFCPKTGRRCQ